MKKSVQKSTPQIKTVSLLEMAKTVGARMASMPRTTYPILIGDTSPRIVWESGALTVGDTDQYVIIMDGLYSALQLLIVPNGTAYTEYPGFCVSGSLLTPKKGSLARLTITLVTVNSWNGIFSTTPLKTKWEVDMAQFEKPILTHPKLTDNMRMHLQLWLAETDTKLKMWAKYSEIDSAGVEVTHDLTSDELIWAEKIKNGVESYLLFSPVITKTTTYDGAPTTTRPGYIDNSGPSGHTIGDFVYLKTADRCVQDDDKKFTRTEQWTGADDWDTDLYTAAGS